MFPSLQRLLLFDPPALMKNDNRNPAGAVSETGRHKPGSEIKFLNGARAEKGRILNESSRIIQASAQLWSVQQSDSSDRQTDTQTDN